MTRTCRFVPVLLAMLLGPAASAQTSADGPSHVPIPRTADSDPNKIFAERIGKAKLRTGLADLLKQLPKGGSGLSKDQFTKLFDDRPELKDALNGLNLGQREGKDQLQEILNGVLSSRPDLKSLLTPSVIEQQLNNVSRLLPPDKAPRGSGPTTKERGSPPSKLEAQAIQPPDISPQEQAARQAWRNSIADWAQRFPQDKLSGPLGNSPTVRNLIRDLTQAGADAMRRGGSNAGLDAELASWESRWKAARDWLPQDWAKGIADRLPTLSRPDFQLPNLNWNPPDVGSPSVGFNAPAIDAAGLGSLALIILGLGLTFIVLWRLRIGKGTAPDRAWRRTLGPWPLDPATVKTRGEVIQAFEYLSLVRCGETVRTWHHRAIALQLGGAESERYAAASRLAALYEHARYAPAGLPEPDWTAARRPLTFLKQTGTV